MFTFYNFSPSREKNASKSELAYLVEREKYYKETIDAKKHDENARNRLYLSQSDSRIIVKVHTFRFWARNGTYCLPNVPKVHVRSSYP